MNFSRYIAFLIFVLLICQSCVQKFYKTDRQYIDSGETALQDFYTMYFDSLSATQLRLVLDDLPLKGDIYSGSKVTRAQSRHRKMYHFVKPFEKLDQGSTYLLEKIIAAGELKDTPRALYYKIATHWLIPRYLSYKIGIAPVGFSERGRAFSPKVFEKKIDEAVIYFLVKSGHSDVFEDFEYLVRIIKNETQKHVGLELLDEIDRGDRKINDFAQELYFRSKSMIFAIEQLN